MVQLPELGEGLAALLRLQIMPVLVELVAVITLMQVRRLFGVVVEEAQTMGITLVSDREAHLCMVVQVEGVVEV